MGDPCGKRLGVVGAPSPPLWIPAFAGMTNVAAVFRQTCDLRESILAPMKDGWSEPEQEWDK